MKRRRAAEVFAGSGRLARALARAGVATDAYDIVDGPGGDFLRPGVVRQFRDRIRAGCFLFAWFGIPCNAFSRATDRPKGPRPLRSNACLCGLPDLGGKLKERVLAAHRLVRTVCSLARECN